MNWDILDRTNPMGNRMFLDKLIEEYMEVKTEVQLQMLGEGNINDQADEIMDVIRLCVDRLQHLNKEYDLDLENVLQRHSEKMKSYETKHDWKVVKTIKFGDCDV